MLESLLTTLSPSPFLLLLLISAIALLESLAFVGLLLPGVALLFGLAFAAGSSGVDPLACLLAGFVGAVLGDGFSFLLGQHAAPRIRQLGWVQRHPDWLDRSEAFFRRWGGLSIVTGRFVGPIRPIIPFVAGSCGLSTARFMTYNLLSALAWAPVYLLPGYLTGHGMHLLPRELIPLLWSLAALAFLLLMVQQIHRQLHPESSLYQHCRRLMPGHWQPAPVLMLFFSGSLFIGATLLSLTPAGTYLNQQLLEPLHQFGQQLPLWALAITLPGDPGLCAALALMSALYGQWRHQQHQGWGVLLGVGIALSLNHLLKLTFALPRPEGAALSTFSFPSGHASAITALVGLSVVWVVHNRHHAIRHLCYLLAAPVILLVALSRPMLGVHWPLDVVAGCAEGLMIAAVYRLWLYRHPADKPIPLAWLALLLGTAILYSGVRLDEAAQLYFG
ncbi:VTT domain-containing protein [Marinobacterium sediminicola]|uniref:Undecaprenyl-diphosphatase n=1 Tax=Marinobacterium sediminicola TaxID=518898 RepID=A0ABY1S1K2_9GAMM|nr:VTT domain-containing protein [Marinobacterium sediminicola]ULG69737.1 VTT domain-containing protein [Marinobacterium sediminicola]SMR75453.1 undecaprenyl-diphosphatase [Marinobacterium sediminicola]